MEPRPSVFKRSWAMLWARPAAYAVVAILPYVVALGLPILIGRFVVHDHPPAVEPWDPITLWKSMNWGTRLLIISRDDRIGHRAHVCRCARNLPAGPGTTKEPQHIAGHGACGHAAFFAGCAALLPGTWNCHVPGRHVPDSSRVAYHSRVRADHSRRNRRPTRASGCHTARNLACGTGFWPRSWGVCKLSRIGHCGANGTAHLRAILQL